MSALHGRATESSDRRTGAAGRPAGGTRALLGLLVAALLAPGCAVLRRPAAPITSVSSWRLPAFEDDLDVASLREAVERTLPAIDKPSHVSRAAAARRLLEVLSQPDARARRAAIAREFTVSRVRDPLLLTAYYEPELPAVRTRDTTYRYPIYARPPDLIDVDPRVVKASCVGCRALAGRLDGKRLLPYLTRGDIDAGALAGRGLELAWTDDLVSLFSLHVQGSGRIRLPDGQMLGVRFAGTNGRPFKSLAKILVQRGHLPPGRGSWPDIRRALSQLPESQRLALLAGNERYTFFRFADGEPIGTLGVELTAGRSIAVDPRLVPLGTVGYLVTDTYRRFVVAQDTGAAILGAHADIFLGAGIQAEAQAGRTRENGTLYLLALR